jgi:hypothetical protein
MSNWQLVNEKRAIDKCEKDNWQLANEKRQLTNVKKTIGNWQMRKGN